MEEEMVYHTPALLCPCMEGLDIKPDGVYVDVTFGGGGHSREILRRLGPNGHLYGFDQDEDAMQNIIDDDRFTFVRSNFCFLTNFMKYYGVEKVDGILADLGVSFHHFDDSERGFSFRFDGDLDMRMNQNALVKASDILETYTESQLADMFYLYGELSNARKLASAIVKARSEKKIRRISDLLSVLEPFFSRDKQKKDMAKVFQAIRIEVNHEMDVLRKLLSQSRSVLKPGGRMVVLTYHSLEDRLVKNYFRAGNFEGKVEQDFFGNRLTPFHLVNNKVIVPDEEEIARNPRSRSAKLRIAELLEL
ncbi:MAG TPA: 16S rRNA (cytosine(1402)-N(4))-methyltransferase RsmH [Paludibacteraceae bacterium]|jgi:16S rRNA (cytosine1402-N4)-methyltransferase|nr:16S rRNA (cytosine(1402)-N(4))-methyltransferase RsmH [Paludibacteraceae bacterium]HQF49176.1 16S rRNA (cytosine(1402)-N(4))-methyltransferase RsmH [Paludibacteraceae bacterium]HQJ89104.1 16S rRNA (cytosine(1402)-N(4))-methyltransferase RsmH [Paludibacteraceae bacterium]